MVAEGMKRNWNFPNYDDPMGNRFELSTLIILELYILIIKNIFPLCHLFLLIKKNRFLAADVESYGKDGDEGYCEVSLKKIFIKGNF
jgi:hypothetical protein